MIAGARVVRFVLALAALAAVVACGRAAPDADAPPEGTPAVRDALGRFPAEARERAEARIADMRRATGKGLVVETLDRLPDELHRKLAALDLQRQNRLLLRAAEERADEEGVDGVYVLLVRDPGRVQVAVWPPENRDLFSDAARFRLYQVFTSKEFDRDPGAGLLRAVTMTRDELQSAVRARQAPPAERGSLPWAALLLLLGGLLGLWGVLTWKRAREPGAAVASDPGAGALGHLVGQSGEWLAGQLTGGLDQPAEAAVEKVDAPPPAAAPEHLSPEEKELWRPYEQP